MSCEALGKLLELRLQFPGDILVPLLHCCFRSEVILGKCYTEQSLTCSMNYGGRGHSLPLQIFLSARRVLKLDYGIQEAIMIQMSKTSVIQVWMKERTNFSKCFLSKTQRFYRTQGVRKNNTLSWIPH